MNYFLYYNGNISFIFCKKKLHYDIFITKKTSIKMGFSMWTLWTQVDSTPNQNLFFSNTLLKLQNNLLRAKTFVIYHSASIFKCV